MTARHSNAAITDGPLHCAGDSRAGSGHVRLLGWIIFFAAVWGMALPWLASRPAIDAHIQWLDERGIDPSAMYYTELEAMKPILKKVNDRLRRQAAPKPKN